MGSRSLPMIRNLPFYRTLPHVTAFTSVLLVFGIVAVGLASELIACPFCGQMAQTFTEEINSMDVVVIAKLKEVPKKPTAEVAGENANRDSEIPKGKFEIMDVIKGKTHIAGVKILETVYFGDAKPGKLFLIEGVDPVKIMWSTPLLISERARDYLLKLQNVPKEGASRLEFFQEFLEDQDDALARDAYDEFAKAPYAAVIDLKPKMKHDQVVAWIKNPDISASRRRLYLTMLGVCGNPNDVPMLEAMLKSSDRKDKAGLDALIACYLTLHGPAGMPLVEDVYLKNPKCEYADTYSAIMALRFHGSESSVIPKARLLEGLRYMLERPQLADLVIPDLARWEDWSQMDRLVKLFKEADEKSSWVRVPVVNYLRACPLPQAKEYIKELETIDPGAVKRANTFFPLGSPTSPSPTPPVPPKTSKAETDSKLEAEKSRAIVSANRMDPTTTDLMRPNTIRNVLFHEDSLLSPNRLMVIGVTWVAGVVIMIVQWTILRGGTVG